MKKYCRKISVMVSNGKYNYLLNLNAITETPNKIYAGIVLKLFCDEFRKILDIIMLL